MKKVKLKIEGMTCAHCSKSVEETLQGVGIKSYVNLQQATVSFSYDETKVSLVYLQRLIKKAGYRLILKEDKSRLPLLTIRLYFAIVVLVLSLIGMVHHLGVHNDFFAFFDDPLFRLAIASLSLVILGLPFNIRALKSIRRKKLGMDFLVSVSTLVAFGLSLYTYITKMSETYFESTTMILAIITIGDKITFTLKKSSGNSTKDALKSDGELATIILPSKKTREIDIDAVAKNDHILIKKGEVVKADGKIISGEGVLDEMILSGESRPRIVKCGEFVYYGTLNLGDSFVIEVTKPAIESLYMGVILESYALDHSEGKLNKLSDFIASIFVPVVFLIALCGFFINYFGMHNSLNQSLVNSISILVVSCPCAFGLAVPLSSLNGYNMALKRGIMFKNGTTFEKIKGVTEFYFDKTGTLTTGEMIVVSSHFVDEGDKAIVKAMEKHSIHPLSKGIQTFLSEVEDLDLQEVKELPGKGLVYQDYELGSRSLLEDNALPSEFAPYEGQKGTKVYLLKKGELRAIMVLEDEIRSGAKSMLSDLKARGVKTLMLTGDNKAFALHIGEELGLKENEIFYELLPNDKLEVIKKNKEEKAVTAYCGDGVNDLLALALVDLSVASYKASGAATSKADVLLLKDDLNLLNETIDLSRHVYYNILQNFIWAIIYNAVMIPLALIGDLPMTLAAVLMIVSNITLILNSWRIRLWKGGKHGNKSKRHDVR